MAIIPEAITWEGQTGWQGKLRIPPLTVPGPDPCERGENGEFLVNGVAVTLAEFIEAGCCELVDFHEDLNNEAEVRLYLEECCDYIELNEITNPDYRLIFIEECCDNVDQGDLTEDEQDHYDEHCENGDGDCGPEDPYYPTCEPPEEGDCLPTDPYYPTCIPDDEIPLDCSALNNPDPFLQFQCPPTEGENAHSSISQVSMNEMQQRIRGVQGQLLGALRDAGGNLSNDTRDKFAECIDEITYNNRDDVYLLGGSSGDTIFENQYCRMFTREETEIRLPGRVTNATSGRFFWFENQQPAIEAEIEAWFNINTELWRHDYEQAIAAEMEAWERYQNAAAWHDAIEQLGECETIQCVQMCMWHPDDPLVRTYGSQTRLRPGSGLATATTGQTTGNHFYTAGTGNGGQRIRHTVRRICEGACDACEATTHRNEIEADGWDLTTPLTPNVNLTGYVSARRTEYNRAVSRREALEDILDECIDLSDLNGWEWLHEPQMHFTYEQLFRDPVSGRNQWLTITQELVIARDGEGEPDPFWPNVSSERGAAEITQNCPNPRFCNFNIPVRYGGPGSNGVTKTFTRSVYPDNMASFNETLYFRTENVVHSLLPSGLFPQTSQETSTFTPGSGIDIEIGNVFTTRLTTYRGIYNYWFSFQNLGHTKAEPRREEPFTSEKESYTEPFFPDLEHRSNIQYSIDMYLRDASGVSDAPSENFIRESDYALAQNPIPLERPDFFAYQCFIEHDSFWQSNTGVPCPPDERVSFEQPFFNRPVALNNLFPTGRVGANWADAKGQAAANLIEQRNDQIFDPNGAFLEYEFVIGPTEMAWIRDHNRGMNDRGLGFNDFLSTDWDCLNGKECVSSFLTNLSSQAISARMPGRERWQYFVDNDWRTFARGAFTYPSLLDIPSTDHIWP